MSKVPAGELSYPGTGFVRLYNNDYNGTYCYYMCLQVNILAMLEHPNIIIYFDSFEEDGVIMIEMEYADGG